MKKQLLILVLLTYFLLSSGCISKKKFTELLSSKEAVDAQLAVTQSKLNECEAKGDDYQNTIDSQSEIITSQQINLSALEGEMNSMSETINNQYETIQNQEKIINDKSNCDNLSSSPGSPYTSLNLPLPYTPKFEKMSNLLNLSYISTVGDLENHIFHQLCNQNIGRIGFYKSGFNDEDIIMMLPLEEIKKDGTHINYIETTDDINQAKSYITSFLPNDNDIILKSTVFIITDNNKSLDEIIRPKSNNQQYNHLGAIEYFQNAGTVFSSEVTKISLGNKSIYCLMYVHEHKQKTGYLKPYNDFSMDEYLKKMGLR